MLLQEDCILNAERFETSLCWFRRDLRLDDHAALYHALKTSRKVHCVFLFDTDILEGLPRDDRRVTFIRESVRELSGKLGELGSTLHVLHGKAWQEIPEIAGRMGADAVFCNRDYEPSAIERDGKVAEALQGVEFLDFKDHVIFERDEVLSGSGRPYAVFTPYRKSWIGKLDGFYLRSYPTERYFSSLAQGEPAPLPSLESLGFEYAEPSIPPGMSGAERLFARFMARMENYPADRDFPALDGTSHLSPHLRFGTISARRLAAAAFSMGGAETFLSELVWRDFFQMILFHNPRLALGHAYQSRFDALVFENDPDKFSAWREGRTGYPLVDAAMRQLEKTGYMHNRLRMVAASFLVKDLHVDWRWGERHFAEKLLDYDFASNNGGWQWSASTGCDAQPWFRIFNPVTQSRRFDPKGEFIRKYLPELENCPENWIHAPPESERKKSGYPSPIVDHAVARQETLALYGRGASPLAEPLYPDGGALT